MKKKIFVLLTFLLLFVIGCQNNDSLQDEIPQFDSIGPSTWEENQNTTVDEIGLSSQKETEQVTRNVLQNYVTVSVKYGDGLSEIQRKQVREIYSNALGVISFENCGDNTRSEFWTIPFITRENFELYLKEIQREELSDIPIGNVTTSTGNGPGETHIDWRKPADKLDLDHGVIFVYGRFKCGE